MFSRGTLGNEDSQLLNAHNNFLKTQSDGLKCELSVREAEISSLKTRLESTERTNQENRMHLEGISYDFCIKGTHISSSESLKVKKQLK